MQLRKDVGILQIDVTVQDGGKTGAKAGVKLAYKHVFAPVFTSEEPPMLLARPRPGKKMLRPERARRCPRPEQLFVTIKRGRVK